MIEIEDLKKEQSVRCEQKSSWIVYEKLYINGLATLIPDAFGITKGTKIAYFSRKGQQNIILMTHEVFLEFVIASKKFSMIYCWIFGFL